MTYLPRKPVPPKTHTFMPETDERPPTRLIDDIGSAVAMVTESSPRGGQAAALWPGQQAAAHREKNFTSLLFTGKVFISTIHR